jgi:hypothetical protein
MEVAAVMMDLHFPQFTLIVTLLERSGNVLLRGLLRQPSGENPSIIPNRKKIASGPLRCLSISLHTRRVILSKSILPDLYYGA